MVTWGQQKWMWFIQGALLRRVLYGIALEQAIGILWLQGLLILHRAEPPGVINDAAEPHTCTKGSNGCEEQASKFYVSSTYRSKVAGKWLTRLPVVLFSLVVKLLQYQKVYDIRHVMIPGECGNERVVKHMWVFIILNIQISLMLTLRRKTHWSFSLKLGPRKPVLGSRESEVPLHT